MKVEKIEWIGELIRDRKKISIKKGIERGYVEEREVLKNMRNELGGRKKKENKRKIGRKKNLRKRYKKKKRKIGGFDEEIWKIDGCRSFGSEGNEENNKIGLLNIERKLEVIMINNEIERIDKKEIIRIKKMLGNGEEVRRREKIGLESVKKRIKKRKDRKENIRKNIIDDRRKFMVKKSIKKDEGIGIYELKKI